MALLTDLAGWVGWGSTWLLAWNRVRVHLTRAGAWQGKAGQGGTGVLEESL